MQHRELQLLTRCELSLLDILNVSAYKLKTITISILSLTLELQSEFTSVGHIEIIYLIYRVFHDFRA